MKVSSIPIDEVIFLDYRFWLVVTGTWQIYCSTLIGNFMEFHHPNWLIFFRRVFSSTTNQDVSPLMKPPVSVSRLRSSGLAGKGHRGFDGRSGVSASGFDVDQSWWTNHRKTIESIEKWENHRKTVGQWWWNITMFNGQIHCKWPCSIVMLNYQRAIMKDMWDVPMYESGNWFGNWSGNSNSIDPSIHLTNMVKARERNMSYFHGFKNLYTMWGPQTLCLLV